MIPGSLLIQKRKRDDGVCTVYLEIEKLDLTLFSLDEVKRLKQELPQDLKARVEHLSEPFVYAS